MKPAGVTVLRSGHLRTAHAPSPHLTSVSGGSRDSDDALESRVRDGDDLALGALIDRHRSDALHLTRSIHPQISPLGVVEEAFERVSEHLRRAAGDDLFFRELLVCALSIRGAPHGTPLTPSAQEASLVTTYRALPRRLREALLYVEIEQVGLERAATFLGTTPVVALFFAQVASRDLRRAWLAAHAQRPSLPVPCRAVAAGLHREPSRNLGLSGPTHLDEHARSCLSCSVVAEAADDLPGVLRLLLRPVPLTSSEHTPAETR